MPPIIERVTESVSLGDGPHWDPLTRSLYYVDVLCKHVHKYTPETNTHTKAIVGSQQPAFIIPIYDYPDHFIVSVGKELHVISWDGVKTHVEYEKKLCQVDDGIETLHNKFNHGKCDHTGRLWAGTMNTIAEGPFNYPPKGTLYSFNSRKPVARLENCQVPTGIAFNRLLQKMYYIDSLRGSIDQYDFNMTTGSITNLKTIFTLSKHDIQGVPDGMAIDSSGKLWVAILNGGIIIQINPDRRETLLNVIYMPVTQLTSLAFGGPNLEYLYVTTSAFLINNDKLPTPPNGAVYRISELGVRGTLVPHFLWKTLS